VVNAWDPAGSDNFKALYPHEVTYCGTIEQAIDGADLCFILTEWKDVREFPLRKYAELMKQAIVIDGRNCYSLQAAADAGIVYDSIGRPYIYPNGCVAEGSYTGK
jgi:UDPglucose 6-dehydrogenase